MASDKGKQPAGKSFGKRKLDEDKTGGSKKQRNRSVLQFFEDAAGVSDGDCSSGDSIFDDDFFEEEEFDLGTSDRNAQSKPHDLPLFPKEEEFEEEFDKMMEERYKNASAFIRFAEDEHVVRRFVEEDSSMPSITDPTTWKVKCAAGRERLSAFCLMQKYVDFKALGNKLRIISAYAVEHVKGHFFIEAEKQSEVMESCKGLCGIYATRLTPVPRNEVPHLLAVRSRRAEISVGMWARVKAGTYKGDLAQVVAVSNAKRRATVKLIPRIDLQALAEKFGGGVALKRTGTPAPKLISSSELEEFRPLIQYRRDRDTGKFLEVLDGLMLKDGYLYKRVPIDSLSFWGVMPSEDELLKFQEPENNESSEVEWLAQLYGDKKKKRTVKFEKGGGKGEGSSSSSSKKTYELFDLVSMGRKDFGLIVGIEKDDYKILKEGAEGHIVQNVGVHEIKNGPFDGKFTALDQHKKPISVNDTVRILEGPMKDRQGIVKQVYRGIIFIYDDSELENGGYICCKAPSCEKIKLSVDSFPGKGGDPSPFGFDDQPSSPKSPLSTEKPWQSRENKHDFNQGERDGFSVGQTLRIRIGPLKGYTCRVVAVRRSDVTVKLDSKQKVLTVKSEHLAEVRGRSSATLMREEPDSSSIKPFDLLGDEGSTGWTSGVVTSANDGGWNSGGSSAPWNSWSSLPSGGVATENNSADQSNSNKDGEDDGWGSKVASKQNSSWATSAADNHVTSGNDRSDNWQKDGDTWNAATAKGSSSGMGSDGWGKAIPQDEESRLTLKEAGESGESAAAVTWGKNDIASDNKNNNWNKQGGSSWGEATYGGPKDADAWGNVNQKMKAPVDSCGEKTKGEIDSWTSWKKPELSLDKGKEGFGSDDWTKGKQESELGGSQWNKPMDRVKQDAGSSWGNEGGSWKKPDGGSSWGKPAGENRKDGDSSGTPNESGSWNKTGGGASWSRDSEGCCQSKEEGGSSWGKRDENSSQSKQDGGSWNDLSSGSKQNAGSSWNRESGGSTWNRQDGGSSWNKSSSGSEARGSWMKGNDSSENKEGGNGPWTKNDGGSWNKSNEGASWGKQGGSSWGQPGGNSSWAQQNESNRGNDDQIDAFGGSGGRRGRGGRGDRGRGGRGDRGRGRFGQGRSFDRDQSSGWNEGDSRGNGRWSDGKRSSWSSNPGDSTGSWNNGGGDNQNQTESWGKPSSFGADGQSTWGGMRDNNQGGGPWKGAGDTKSSGCAGASWGEDKDSASGWNKSETWNAPPNASDGGGSSWNQQQAGDTSKVPGDDSKGMGSSWGKNEEKGKNEEGWKKAEGDSWGKKEEDHGSSWGAKQSSSGGTSWNSRKQDGGDSAWKSDGTSWNKGSGGEDKSGGGWKSGGGGSSWNKDGDAEEGAGNGWKSGGGDSSWNKGNGAGEGSGGGWQLGGGGSSLKGGGGEGSSGGWKSGGGGSSWNKGGKAEEGSGGGWKSGGGGSSWNKGGEAEEGSGGGWKSGGGGSSWNKGSKAEEGSGGGWKSGGGGSSWNKGGEAEEGAGGGSSWKGGREAESSGGWTSGGGGSSWKGSGEEGAGGGWKSGGGGSSWKDRSGEESRGGGRGSWGRGGGRRGGRGGFGGRGEQSSSGWGS